MSNNQENNNEGIPIFELWKKYEKIAMHFNDLIVKIRIQALGAVAALATIAGILGKVKGNSVSDYNWGFVSVVFFFLIVFWIAIWILDFCYYNRLLQGAVTAILEIEEFSKDVTNTHIKEIQLSTYIVKAVEGKGLQKDATPWYQCGRRLFYILVFTALLVGLIVSTCKFLCLQQVCDCV